MPLSSFSLEAVFAAFFGWWFVGEVVAPGAVGRLRVDPCRRNPGPGQRILLPHIHSIIKLIYFGFLPVCRNDKGNWMPVIHASSSRLVNKAMRAARNIFLGLFLLFFTISVGGGLFGAT